MSGIIEDATLIAPATATSAARGDIARAPLFVVAAANASSSSGKTAPAPDPVVLQTAVDRLNQHFADKHLLRYAAELESAAATALRCSSVNTRRATNVLEGVVGPRLNSAGHNSLRYAKPTKQKRQVKSRRRTK